MNDKRPKIGLVIGAGGIKCAAALGVYETLTACGHDVDLLVGCSGGAIYAACLALGYSAAAAEEAICATWTREITQVKRPFSYLVAFLPQYAAFKESFGLRDDRLIMERLEATFGAARIEETAVPLRINATDFDTGEAVVFEKGRLVDLIRASIAIPGVFQPWRMAGRLYSDGMLSNPLPIDVAAAAGVDIIIAVGFRRPIRQQITNARRYKAHVHAIMSNSLLQTKVALCQDAYAADILFLEPDFGEPVHIFDAHKIPQVVAAGRQSMWQQMDWLEKRLCQQSNLRKEF
ncbi:MAG: patatin-like phospholipase family protein [Chloroflexota bacterium]